MKNSLVLALVITSLNVHAQYYYNDIVGTAETNRQMQTFLSNKVATVSATGVDQRGAKATDFSEYQEVKESGKALRLTSIVDLNKKITYSRFDDQNRVIRTSRDPGRESAGRPTAGSRCSHRGSRRSIALH